MIVKVIDLYFLCGSVYNVVQGGLLSRVGAVVRALAHQCGLGSIPYEGWVCCWFSSYSEGISQGSPFFLPPQKPTSPNSNSTS